MMAATTDHNFLKELHRLSRNIDKLTCGQARIDPISDEERVFYFDITPNDGYYKGATCLFKVFVSENYPDKAPYVTCLSRIYHPNIDIDSETAVCVNLLSTDWQPEVGLDGCIMAVLFLFHNPNLEDALSPVFPPIDKEEFERNIWASLRGGEVEDILFDKLINEADVITDETNRNLNNEPDLITDEIKSNLNNELDLITDEIKSNLNNELDLITDEIKSNLNNEPDLITDETKSNLNNELDLITDEIKSNLNNELDLITDETKNNLNNEPDLITDETKSNLNNELDLITDETKNNLNNEPDLITDETKSNLNSEPDCITDEINCNFNTNHRESQNFTSAIFENIAHSPLQKSKFYNFQVTALFSKMWHKTAPVLQKLWQHF